MGEHQQDDLDLEEGEIPDSPGNVAATAGAEVAESKMEEDIHPSQSFVEDEVPVFEDNHIKEKRVAAPTTATSTHDSSDPEGTEHSKKRLRNDKTKNDKYKKKEKKATKKVKPLPPKYRNFEDELQAYIGAQKGYTDGDSDPRSFSSDSEGWEDDRPSNKKRKIQNSQRPPPRPKYKSNRDKKGPLPPRQRKEKYKPICKFFQEGKCFKGPECSFAHIGAPIRRRELCKYYLGGSCYKGEHCNFMHGDFPCKFHHTGATCYAGEEKCKFSHAPLTEETRVILDRYLHNDRYPTHHANEDNSCAVERLVADDDSPNKRPSLLGSPPRHIKDAAGQWQQHMREIQKNKGRPRPQFYVDTLSSGNGIHTPPREEGDCTPPYCEDDGWGEEIIHEPSMVQQPQRSEPPPIWASNGENQWDMGMNVAPQPPPQVVHQEPEPVLNALPAKTRELYQRIHLQQKEASNSHKPPPPTPGSEDPWGKNPSTDDDDDDDDDDDAKLTESLKKLRTAPQPLSAVSPSTLDVNKILNVLGPNQTNNNFWNQLTSIVSAVQATPVAQQTPIFTPPMPQGPPMITTPPPSFTPTMPPPPFNASVPPPPFPMLPIPPPAMPPVPELPIVAADHPQQPTVLASRDPRLTSRDPRKRDPRQQARPEPVAEPPPHQEMKAPSVALTNHSPTKTTVVDPSNDAEINGIRWLCGPINYKLREAERSQINYFSIVMSIQSNPQLRNDPRLAKRIEQTPKTLFPPALPLSVGDEIQETTPPPLLRPVVDPRLAGKLHNAAKEAAQTSPPLPASLNITPESPPELKKVEPLDALRQEEPGSPPILTEEDAKPASAPAPPSGILRRKKKDSVNRRNSMDYASPLNTCDNNANQTAGGYNAYNRRPARPAVTTITTTITTATTVSTPSVPLPSVPSTPEYFDPASLPPPLPETELPAFLDTEEICNLKDVFKNRDPTASPFC